MSHSNRLPLVYSCSGCSNLAQMANDLAVRLDREGKAEMSCIAGVGGNVKPLLRKATSGRPILAIDGCPLHCVTSCLSQHGVSPAEHLVLTEHGLKKRYGESVTADTLEQMYAEVVELIIRV